MLKLDSGFLRVGVLLKFQRKYYNDSQFTRTKHIVAIILSTPFNCQTQSLRWNIKYFSHQCSKIIVAFLNFQQQHNLLKGQVGLKFVWKSLAVLMVPSIQPHPCTRHINILLSVLIRILTLSTITPFGICSSAFYFSLQMQRNVVKNKRCW